MLGQRLAEERRRLGLTQAQLAERMGVGRTAVTMIESGRAKVDAQRLIDLGSSTGLDVLYVMSGRRASMAASMLIDWDVMKQAIEALRRWSVKRRVQLSAEKESAVLKVVYERFCLERKVDDEVVEAIADIAA